MSDEMKVFACWNTFCECEKKMLVELSQSTRDAMDRLNPQNVHLMHCILSSPRDEFTCFAGEGAAG